MEILLTINTFTLITTIIAIYRITALVIDDEIFDRPRDFIHRKMSKGGLKGIAYLITCYWCLSFWVGIVCVPLILFVPVVWGPLSLVLTASAVAGILGAVIPR